jgi:PknH-like extracellular domain
LVSRRAEEAIPVTYGTHTWPPPPEPGKPRRTLAIALIGGAVIVLVAVIAVVGVVVLTGRTHESGSAPAAAPQSSPATAPANAPSIDTLLLGPDEVDQVMGTTDMLSDAGVITKLFDSDVRYAPPECRGVLTSGALMQFGQTGYIAVREQDIENASAAVGEDVLQYKSPDVANNVVDSLFATWESCRGKSVIQTAAKSSNQVEEIVQDVVRGRHKVSALITIPKFSVPNYVCQHVVEAVSIFIIDALACNSNVVNQADIIASKIADKVGH